MRHTLRVDMAACAGHGVCAELLPEWIELDDWGYPMVREGAVPAELMDHARWAVANCPALALRLRREKAGAWHRSTLGDGADHDRVGARHLKT